MAKKQKAVYAPGELSRVREKLGNLDDEEARQLMEKLGGEIGYERTSDEEKAKQDSKGRVRKERVEVKIGDQRSRPKRSVELPLASETKHTHDKKKPVRRKEIDPADDPSVLLKVSYWDRIKLDKYAGQPEFEIKSGSQVFQSMLSFFSPGPDMVNPVFVTTRMTEYYKKIESLVVSTRTLFPRNNARRNERLKRSFPLVYTILDVIRYWNIEKISGDLARIQAYPRNAKVSDFTDIIRAVYRPLFILAWLDPDTHIRASYKILYKVLYIENPMEAQSNYQELIRLALTAFSEIRRDIHFLLFPLFMKMVSNKFIEYENFFSERRNRIMAFLNITEDDQIDPVNINTQSELWIDEGPQKEEIAEEKAKDNPPPVQEPEKEKELTEEEKERLEANEADKKALKKGLQTLEILFPQAGWDKIESFPDLYPYFVNTFDLKKGKVNIPPTDPLQQILILMRILEELFFGLRYVSFGSVPGTLGLMERVDTILMDIINSWRYYFETSFEKEYLPRMANYIRIFEGSSEERGSPYTKKLAAELHWIKRLYFLPYYKFETLVPPPLQKKEIIPIYSKIKTLRKYLTAVAVGIEQGNKNGGQEAQAPCDGIENPWAAYNFQVPNPLSIRLDALLPPKGKNNASLIYFCLAVATVLDYIVNNEESWAYTNPPGPLFRSEDGKGIRPLTGVDERIDAEALFKQSLKQRQKKPGES